MSPRSNTARIFAVSRTAHVVVCPSADRQYCGHTTEWQHGWLIFVDADHDGLRDDSEELLAVGERQPEGVAILSTAGRTHVDYRPDGSAPGSNVTFTVCDRRGAGDATALVINNAGRVRSRQADRRRGRAPARRFSTHAGRLTLETGAQDNRRLARIAQPVRASDC